MSGHSHWATIKHKKGAEDKKRGQLFSKLSRAITVAARKGGDPETNSALRIMIEQAKKANMPNENIEKAIKRGTGEIESEALEEFSFEAYGPAKSALIVTGITNNKNRTLGEIRQILIRHNAKMAEEGAVRWQFENRGIIVIDPQEKPREEVEMAIIESGAEDMKREEDMLEAYTKPDDLEKVKKSLEEKGIYVASASLGWIPKDEIEVEEREKEKIEKLFEELDSNNDVQEIYSNVKL